MVYNVGMTHGVLLKMAHRNNGDFPELCKRLPEGKSLLRLRESHIPPTFPRLSVTIHVSQDENCQDIPGRTITSRDQLWVRMFNPQNLHIALMVIVKQCYNHNRLMLIIRTSIQTSIILERSLASVVDVYIQGDSTLGLLVFLTGGCDHSSIYVWQTPMF